MLSRFHLRFLEIVYSHLEGKVQKLTGNENQMIRLANQQISHLKDSYAPFVDCFDILLAGNQYFHQSHLHLYCVKLYVRKSPTKGITSYNNSSQLYCKIIEFYKARIIYSIFYIAYCILMHMSSSDYIKHRNIIQPKTREKQKRQQ